MRAKEGGGRVQVKAMSTVHWDQAEELPVRGILGQWPEGRGGRRGCRGESGSDLTSTSAVTSCGSEARSHTRDVILAPPTSVAQVVLASTSIAGRTLGAGTAMLVGGLADPVSPGDRTETP